MPSDLSDAEAKVRNEAIAGDFRQHWRRHVRPLILKVIKERESQSFWYFGNCIAGLAAFAFTGAIQVFDVFDIFDDEVDPILRIYFLVLPFVAGWWVYRIVNKIWSREFTESYNRIGRAICAFHGLEYLRRYPQVSTHALAGIGLVPSHGKVEFSHPMRGHIDGAEFRLAEAVLLGRFGQHSELLNHADRDVILRAVLVQARYLGNEKETLVVASDKGYLRNRLKEIFNEAERVRLEDPAFERAFEVFARDQIRARYLLEPNLMEAILKLGRDEGVGGAAFALEQGWLWVVIPVRQGEFSLGDAGRADELIASEKFARIVNYAVGLTRLINAASGAQRPERPPPKGVSKSP